jgi:hypothetical protein
MIVMAARGRYQAEHFQVDTIAPRVSQNGVFKGARRILMLVSLTQQINFQ